MLSHHSTKTSMRPSFIQIMPLCLWLSVLQSAFLCSGKCCITSAPLFQKINKALLISSQWNFLCEIGSRQCQKWLLLTLFFFWLFFFYFVSFWGRSDQNHPRARGHGDYCGGEHRVTLSGRQWPRSWRFLLLGLQWTAHRQGRRSLWACGWGEWPAVVLLQNVRMGSWHLIPSCSASSLPLVKRDSLRFDMMVSPGEIHCG